MASLPRQGQFMWHSNDEIHVDASAPKVGKAPPLLPAQRAQAELITLKRLIGQQTDQYEFSSAFHADLAAQARILKRERTRLYRRLHVRRAFSAASTGVLIIMVGLTIALGIAVLFSFLSMLPLALLFAFVISCLTALVFVGWQYHRERWSEDSVVLEAEIRQHQARVDQAENERSSVQQQMENDGRDLESTWARYRVRELNLLDQDWNKMKGRRFEEFLADVFEVWGYQVQLTKASGDHGVDLIVEGRGMKIAIQAKRWKGGVDNKAIQEVYLGKDIYRCDCCVVITSSRFTRAARKAAKVANCVLLSGRDIPALIRGELRLEEMFLR